MPSHLTSWRSILILYSHVRLDLPSGLFPSGFPTKTLYVYLLSPICATCYVHLILLDLVARIILGEQYRSLTSSLCSFFPLPCYFVPLRPKYSPQHPILKHPQPRFLPRCQRPSFTPIQNVQSLWTPLDVFVKPYFSLMKGSVCGLTSFTAGLSAPYGVHFLTRRCPRYAVRQRMRVGVLTYSTEQSPSWEANWFCFPAFSEIEGSSPYPQAPATCPYPEPTPSSPHNSLPLPEDPS